MGEPVKCPKCGSSDLMYSKKKRLYICEDCSHEFVGELRPASRRIYLSYGMDEHSVLAMQIKRDLEARGHQVWFDPDCAKEGEERDKFVDAGMDWVSERPGEGLFLVVLTPASVRRPGGYCLPEIAKAVQRKLRIIPIMADFCDTPLSICRIQWLDMMDCRPPGEKVETYQKKFDALTMAIDGDRSDIKGVQSRLLHVLDPLPFDADVQRHLARFVGRQWVFRRVDAWLADPEAPRVFWVIGPPGAGKTAIAAWLAANRPQIAALHLCRYGDAQKSDPRRAIMSIAYQLSTQLPDYRDRLNALNLEKIARESNAKALFDGLIVQPLSEGAEPGRVMVVLIDALDEATQAGRNELAELIASEIEKVPRWLRLIITSRPEPEVQQPLQGLTPYTLDTSSPENEHDIRDFLARELEPYAAGKGVPPEAIGQIVAMSEGIFLYVEWIRQELAQKRLSLDRLSEFPRGLTGVYSQFFTRQFPAIDGFRTRISPVLEAVVAALEPLPIDLIGRIFKWDEYDQADFRQELGAMFPITEGKVQPFHRSVIDWLTDAGKAASYYIDRGSGHGRLSDYGWGEYAKGVGAMSGYMTAHLPAHLIETRRWGEVRSMLADIAYFEIAWAQSKFNFKSYWTRIEERSGFQMVEAYRDIVDHPEEYQGKSKSIAVLMRETGHYGEALKLIDYLALYYRSAENLPDLEDVLGDKGRILIWTGKVTEAMKLFREQEEICRKLGDVAGLQDCLYYQVDLMATIGDFDGICAIVDKMESSSDKGNKKHLEKFLHARGTQLYYAGDFNGALKMYAEREKICRELNDYLSVCNSLNNQADIRYQLGDLDAAMKLNQENERIARAQSFKTFLKYALLNQGDIYYEIGEPDRAVQLFKESEEISRELGEKIGIALCAGNLSVIYQDAGDLDKAAQLDEEVIAICREINDKMGLHAALGNLATIYIDRGMLAEAMELLDEKERICGEAHSAIGTKNVYGGRALVLYGRDELAEAMRLRKLEEALCRQMSAKNDLYVCLGNQADILYQQGDLAGALELCGEAEREFRERKYAIYLPACLNTKALVLYGLGRSDEALAVLKEAEGVCHKINSRKGLMASLCNQAIILREGGQPEPARKLLDEALRGFRTAGYEEGLATVLTDLAIITAYDDREPDRALAMAREAADIVRRHGIKILEKRVLPVFHAIEGMKGGPLPAADGGTARAPGLIPIVVKNPKREIR